MKAIIHADDFGVTYGVNEGIEKAFKEGILSSTSIRTNGIAYDDAVKRLTKPLKKIGLGLHLNLTDGKTHLPSLRNNSGFYKYSFPLYLIHSFRQVIRKHIYEELDEQFRIIKESGLTIDHVDGQDHIHMIPSIFDIVCKLCVKHNIQYIRVAAEPWYTLPTLKNSLHPVINGGLLKAFVLSVLSVFDRRILKKYNLGTTDSYYGVLHTNFMTDEAFIAIAKNALSRKWNTIEIACHPAIPNDFRDKKYTSPFFKFYTNLPSRKMELETLLSERVKTRYEKRGISLIRFGDLMK